MTTIDETHLSSVGETQSPLASRHQARHRSRCFDILGDQLYLSPGPIIFSKSETLPAGIGDLFWG